MKKLVVFTGAGISAESGLATFRDSNGLWENYRPEDVAHIDAVIITQNVDDLHERAGSTNVIHLHGELTKICPENDKSIGVQEGGGDRAAARLEEHAAGPAGLVRRRVMEAAMELITPEQRALSKSSMAWR